MMVLLWHNGVLVARAELTRNQVAQLADDGKVDVTLFRDFDVGKIWRADSLQLTLDASVPPVS